MATNPVSCCVIYLQNSCPCFLPTMSHMLGELKTAQPRSMSDQLVCPVVWQLSGANHVMGACRKVMQNAKAGATMFHGGKNALQGGENRKPATEKSCLTYMTSWPFILAESIILKHSQLLFTPLCFQSSLVPSTPIAARRSEVPRG